MKRLRVVKRLKLDPDLIDPDLIKKDNLKHIALDIYRDGIIVGTYCGIVKGDNIIAATTSWGKNKDAEIIILKLKDTEELPAFIYDIMYRKLHLDSALGYGDSRITKKFSAKDFESIISSQGNEFDIDEITYHKILKSEQYMVCGIINGFLHTTPYYQEFTCT